VFPSGPVVKICGLTRLADVLLAARLGAWALGFVFAPSPRRLAPAAARELIVQASDRLLRQDPSCDGRCVATLPLTVGVFGDAPAEEIAEAAEAAGVDAVQLHGLGATDGAATTNATATAVKAALKHMRGVGGRDGCPLIIQAVPVPADQALCARPSRWRAALPTSYYSTPAQRDVSAVPV
jgi:phosphoribosylanthranilate isomerase